MSCPENRFSAFEDRLFRTLPRIISQLDRDPDSPTYGSFDRDFWHYKIRDFSSVVLQQGMLILELLHSFNHRDNFLYKHDLAREWADASLNFWGGQQLTSGAFNEYYPFEEGYPPTAFSMYAVALLLRWRNYPKLETSLLEVIQKGVDWLLSHQESEALNQEGAALTALTLLVQQPGVAIGSEILSTRLDNFFDRQSEEGWFSEYGGADIGYLSVILDCLWDYHEVTGDPRGKIAMERGVRFIAGMVSVAGSTPVMINSRNTDYVVPYGLIRMAESDPLAKRLVEVLFGSIDDGTHFLDSTDDRYLCHYVYQSCFRGMVHLGKMTSENCRLPCEKGEERLLAEAGVFFRHLPGEASFFVAARKGGVAYLYSPDGVRFADFGWRQKIGGGAVLLTHWQHPDNTLSGDSDPESAILEIRGTVTKHKQVTSSVLSHIALRFASFVMGNGVFPFLKKRMIFNSLDTGVNYHRQIRIRGKSILIRDTFSGEGIDSFRPEPAPQYSLRHVASAGNFSKEELLNSLPAPVMVEKYEDRIVFENSFELKNGSAQNCPAGSDS